jgi:hypothetical protein
MSAHLEEAKSAAPGFEMPTTSPSEEGEKKVILIQAPTEAAAPGFEVDEEVARQAKNMVRVGRSRGPSSHVVQILTGPRGPTSEAHGAPWPVNVPGYVVLCDRNLTAIRVMF